MGVETNGNKRYRWAWTQTETNATDGRGNKRYRLHHYNDATGGRATAVLCSLRPGCIRDWPLPLIHNRHQQLHCRQQTLSSHSIEGALPQWTTGVEMSRYRLMYRTRARSSRLLYVIFQLYRPAGVKPVTIADMLAFVRRV